MKTKKISDILENAPDDINLELEKKSNVGHKHPMVDIEGLSLESNAVEYDNITSGLTSDKVQGAIDEINAKAESNKTSISSLEKQLGTQISRAKTILTSLSSKVE